MASPTAPARMRTRKWSWSLIVGASPLFLWSATLSPKLMVMTCNLLVPRDDWNSYLATLNCIVYQCLYPCYYTSMVLCIILLTGTHFVWIFSDICQYLKWVLVLLNDIFLQSFSLQFIAKHSQWMYVYACLRFKLCMDISMRVKHQVCRKKWERSLCCGVELNDSAIRKFIECLKDLGDGSIWWCSSVAGGKFHSVEWATNVQIQILPVKNYWKKKE